MLDKVLKITVAPAIAILCAGVIAHLQISRLAATEAKMQAGLSKEEYLQEEAQYKNQLAILDKIPPSSFDNLIADTAFLSFVQYFGDDEGRAKTGYPITAEFFKVVVDRDPLFLGMYPYLSGTVTLFGGQPLTSVELIEQGIQAMPPQLQPEAFFLGQAKGTDELLFVGQPLQAQKSYELAAEWASRSSDPEVRAKGQRSAQTARFLAGNPDSHQAQVSAWTNVLVGAVDNRTRQLASQQIQRLGGQVSITENGVLQVQLPKEQSQ